MRYLSVCSGIEAATCAWHPLGWTSAGFSEIERFPSAVLAHHYPDVPNFGDMTRFQEWPDDLAPSLLVGGTPCQSFSVAGLRGGLADPRGNLALVYLALADRYRPEWLVWENVPGVLSSNGGRDFGAFLGGLVELGYGFAYRVLDAQYFGVAQRRRRVFVVANARDWRRAAAVLFEPNSLSGHPAPRREAGQDTSGSTGDGVARCLTTGEAKRQDWETCNMVAAPVALFDERNVTSPQNRATCRADGAVPTMHEKPLAVAYDMQNDAIGGDISSTLQAEAQRTGNRGAGVLQGMAVRRLMPVECERLQGFRDGYTAIPWRGKPAEDCPDGPRYKALGNSMAVPVMAWIGKRIAVVAAQRAQAEAA